jgi:prepilin-type N-terminal cleavage/methylation domain-containing protein
MPHPFKKSTDSGFTVLELLVAVSVTALLAGMLLNITSQVVSTQTQASADLETNQVAQFILDRIQEDLHCAVYRNDGNVWMVANILEDTTNSDNWIDDDVVAAKPKKESLRIVPQDWTDGPNDLIAEANNQLSLIDSRFGMAGTFFRFITLAPEIDPDVSNTGGGRAVSYQIIRHGVTKAETSRSRYQLFRSDVTTKETFMAGYNLHPEYGKYLKNTANGSREIGNIVNPIFTDAEGDKSMAFSLASNVIDFGIRAYYFQENAEGDKNLIQIFPDVNSSHGGGLPPYQFMATSNIEYIKESKKPYRYSKFPEVIDVMLRILSSEGASAITAFEEGLIPTPNGFTAESYWWNIAEKNSEVYVRRIRVFPSGI